MLTEQRFAIFHFLHSKAMKLGISDKNYPKFRNHANYHTSFEKGVSASSFSPGYEPYQCYGKYAQDEQTGWRPR